jgi:hypothetical protein
MTESLEHREGVKSQSGARKPKEKIEGEKLTRFNGCPLSKVSGLPIVC